MHSTNINKLNSTCTKVGRICRQICQYAIWTFDQIVRAGHQLVMTSSHHLAIRCIFSPLSTLPDPSSLAAEHVSSQTKSEPNDGLAGKAMHSRESSILHWLFRPGSVLGRRFKLSADLHKQPYCAFPCQEGASADRIIQVAVGAFDML